MLKQCNEDDFYTIKMEIDDRLSPENIIIFFWGALVLSGIMILVITIPLYGPGHYLTNPLWFLTHKIFVILFVIQLIVTLFYSLKKNAYRYQRVQSVFLSLFSLKTSSFDVYAAFFMFCEGRDVPSNLIITTIALWIGGFIFLLLSTIRAIKRVQQGELRKNGKGLYNIKQTVGNANLPIIFGVVMIGGAIVRKLSDSAITLGTVTDLYFILMFPFILQYMMVFALPEHFLYTYCKLRFKSFHVPMPNPEEEEARKKPNVKRCPIEYHNVISTTTRCKIGGWSVAAEDFEEAISSNGLEMTETLIYKISNINEATNEADYTFYIPVEPPVEMDKIGGDFYFHKRWKFDDGFLIKNRGLDFDMEDEDFYDLLRMKAKEEQLILKSFYKILDEEGYVYYYAPIVEEQKEKHEVI
ncbi:hypothetical protein H1Z61_00250 [Bacillus aquiflavi]|uniref:Uncharacterized protein n=1 Tax=Bacillus aquiflavi TaxID=2672567 RepID=A0A6B3VX98_9BACI|nr:hypothetical protein [Bacillus aquiflavi]MBA4535598.1 hypothetical protein [Bacillus aquiflavi]NEY79974.1 hypothetical protein [Bacillus aquiflavi]